MSITSLLLTLLLSPLRASDDLIETVPGDPGSDYPIYSSVPDTSFLCDGQVDGGYYADPEADCQAFHICAGDGTGSLTRYSFLCPNGTLFNQQYFVCDWWFNVDCSTVEDFYFLNQELGVESGSSGLSSYRPGGGSLVSESLPVYRVGEKRRRIPPNTLQSSLALLPPRI